MKPGHEPLEVVNSEPEGPTAMAERNKESQATEGGRIAKPKAQLPWRRETEKGERDCNYANRY